MNSMKVLNLLKTMTPCFPIGVIVAFARDQTRILIEGLSKVIIGGTTEETETSSFLLGLQLATKIEASGFIIEGDCQSITKLLLEKTANHYGG